MTLPTENGHAAPPVESRKSCQSDNSYCVGTWWAFPCWVKLSRKLHSLLFSSLLFSSLLFSSLLFSSLLFSSLLFSSLLFSSLPFPSLPFSSLPFPSLLFSSLSLLFFFSSLLFSSLLFPSLLFSSLLFPSLLFSSLLFPSLLFSSLLFSSLLFSSLLFSSSSLFLGSSASNYDKHEWRWREGEDAVSQKKPLTFHNVSNFLLFTAISSTFPHVDVTQHVKDAWNRSEKQNKMDTLWTVNGTTAITCKKTRENMYLCTHATQHTPHGPHTVSSVFPWLPFVSLFLSSFSVWCCVWCCVVLCVGVHLVSVVSVLLVLVVVVVGVWCMFGFGLSHVEFSLAPEWFAKETVGSYPFHVWE